ncbi:MAG: cytochrome c biogenesis protein CcsA [Saprospiraceae bacterium]
MEEIQYIGEHLWPGRIGHFAIILSFATSLLASIAYFFATNRRKSPEYGSWLKIGRIGFLLHAFSIFTIVATFFFILVNNYYEYNYVWANTSDDLPFEYVFSAFWKDQEGSFLIWLFWHAVLGLILLFRAGKWEAPVLSILSLVQVVIGSMILGIYVGWDEMVRVGVNPFLLLRDVMDAPIFAKADYLTLIEGKGLNPLLQNYWMTIHPPTLFLGFASTVVPFCYAVAGLWVGAHKEWLKPAQPWALFSGAILGIGILMGGAWAYEALTFGGYWAWDPVENMSLVPWLVLIAGIHTHLIAKSTGHSIRSTYLFYILTFVLVLYSTFLTRSGVLGDTSVHAFTELGLENQLLALIFIFLGIGLFLFFKRYKSIPAPEQEEATSSKEFWMFIGALVLLFSASMITVSTSLPVYNKIRQIFEPDFVGHVVKDPVDHYNRYQLYIGVFIGLLSAFAQFLRFREGNFSANRSKFLKHVSISALIAAVLTVPVIMWIDHYAWQFILLLFSGLFTIVANLDYIFSFVRNNWKTAGSAISHIGFGIMIVGIMSSGIMKHHISKNAFVMKDLLDQERLEKNIILYKGLPMFMSGYEVEYKSDTLINHNRYYEVSFTELDEKGNKGESFTIHPNVLYDNDFEKVAAANPDTKHYLFKDVFTHIASLPAEQFSAEEAKNAEDSLKYEPYIALEGDTFFTKKNFGIVESIDRKPSHPDYEPEEGDIAIGTKIAFSDLESDSVYYANPVIVLRGQLVYTYSDKINELGLKVKLGEEMFQNFFPMEDSLNYQQFTFKQGDTIHFQGWDVQFAGFNKEVNHEGYKAEEGDIAVSAVMNVFKDDEAGTAEPVYLIRDSRPFNLKDEVAKYGFHFRFTGIDPATETVTMLVAKVDPKTRKIPMEIAENATRNDWIVLESIVFPGINFFWIGSLMMMIGLAISMWLRMGQNRKTAAI